MKHELKIWREYFEAVESGVKTFEYRSNDRNYKPNDTLVLREYDPETEKYSGREIEVTVTYILYGGNFVIMSIRKNGRWKKLYEKSPRYVCSVCNHLFNNRSYKYCPFCGAKMDEEVEDE